MFSYHNKPAHNIHMVKPNYPGLGCMMRLCRLRDVTIDLIDPYSTIGRRSKTKDADEITYSNTLTIVDEGLLP